MNKHIQKFIFLFILTILHGKNDHMASESENRNNTRQQLHTVAAGNYYYQPSILNINVGDTVRFINETGFHDVEVTLGQNFLVWLLAMGHAQ